MEWVTLMSGLNVTSNTTDVRLGNASWSVLPDGAAHDSSGREDPKAGRPPPPIGGPPGFDDPLVILFQAISTQLQLYGTPSYCGFGLLGNLLSGIVLLKSDVWTFSAARYLLALITADVIYLLYLLITWLSDVQGVGVYAHGGLCHFTTFLSHGSCFLALWYLVCFAVDGYIRICFRRRQEALCTTTRANVVILAFVAVAIAVFINISITFGVSVGPVLRCAPLKMFMVTLQTLFKIDIFLNSMLPDVVILLLGAHALLVCVYESSKDSGGRSDCCSCSSSCCWCKHCSCCCCRQDESILNDTPLAATDLRVTRQQSNPSLDSDFRRLFFVYILIPTCLNITSHMPRIYFTIHGLLYPRTPLTMRDFIWQQVLIHAYYLRCTINFPLLFCASRNFRQVCCAVVTLLAGCVRRARLRGNPSGHATEGGPNCTNGNEEDETVTALMKDVPNSTTPV